MRVFLRYADSFQHKMSLRPPFKPQNSLRSLDDGVNLLPATITIGKHWICPRTALDEFIKFDLSTPRLDKIYQYLWLASKSIPAQPLHRQRVLRREIVPTENPDEHLVEHIAMIFIKPLPQYLLSFDFWDKHLGTDTDLRKSACGLLLSYVWIVAYSSDLRIAKETHLLPKSLSWRAWKDFVQDFLEHLGPNTAIHTSKRYHYGELWLGDLNKIYKLSPTTFSLDNLHSGFLHAPLWYGFFIQRNITRLVAIFAFLSLLLSAMQVGQATNELQDSIQFSRASYGLSATTIFLVLISVVAVILAYTLPRLFRLLKGFRLRRRLRVI